MAKIAQDITALIGNTPLVKVNRLTRAFTANLVAKLNRSTRQVRFKRSYCPLQ